MPVLAGFFLMLYSVIIALYALKKLKKDPKSIVNTTPYPAVWVRACF